MRKNIFPLILFFLSPLISSSQSLIIECKRQRNSCNANSALKILDREISIDKVKPSGSYKILLFKNAKISFLPLKIGEKFPQLEGLKVLNSSLEEVRKENFENLEDLTEINLSENLLQNLPVDVFHSLKNLKKIFLEKNQISSLPSKLFEFNLELIEISLLDNQLQTLHDATFKNLKNLQKIFLTSNQLEDLKGGTFDDNEELKVLNVAKNLLKYIPEDIFDKNLKLVFNKRYFIDNKCIDASKKLEDREDFVEVFKESCKPMNFDKIQELKEEIANLTESLESSRKDFYAKNEDFEKMKKTNEGNEEKVKDKEEKIEELDKDIEGLKEEKSKLEDENEELKKSLKDSKDEIENLNEKVKELSGELDDKNQEINERDKKIENHEKQLEDKQREIDGFRKLWAHCEKEFETIKNETTKNDKNVKELEAKNYEISQNLTETENLLREKIERCKDIEDKHENLQRTNDALLYLLKANKTVEDLKVSGKDEKQNVATSSAQPTLDIACNFTDFDYKLQLSKIATYYTCHVENFHALACSSTLGDLQGHHIGLKDSSDVSGLSIVSSSFIEFPSNVFDKSPIEFVKVRESNFGRVEKFCDDRMKFLIIFKSFLGGSSMKIENCENLLHLNVESSNLKEISLENLRHLTDLSLKNNEIEKIPENFFDSMKKLKNLQMSKNKISSLSSKIFIKNSKLEVVNFSENPIQTIEGDIFKGNKNLVRIDFVKSGCINKRIAKASEVEEMKKEIKEKCEN